MIELPLKPPATSGTPIGRFQVTATIGVTPYVFDARWNSRDAAWYLDLFEIDLTPIAYGIKVVLGAYLGRRVDHQLFRDGVIVAVDTSGKHVDAGLSDIGTRIAVFYIPVEEAQQAIQLLQERGQ